MLKRQALISTLAFALAAAIAQAQSGTGRISGVVKDSSGAVVPGAAVIAQHEQTGVRHATTTTQSGLFVFPSLPIGPYSVTAELQGFKRSTRTKNLLTVAADLNVPIVMAPGGLEETVTVTSDAKLVQSTESSLSTLVTEQTIVTLPLNGRNPLHLIGLVPGVVGHSAEATASGGTATHYVNGDRGRGITSTQDGVDISDPVIPRGELTNAPVNPDAVEEFRIITSNPKAEYGRTAGAQVEMVTKSGTNKLKGSIYEFMRNTSFDTNSYFNKLRGLPTEELSRHQFGLSLGGPIKKDKAFFFVNYEGQRRTQDTSQVVTVPTQAVREPPRLRGRDRQPAAARLLVQLRRERSAPARARSRDAGGDPEVPAAAERLHDGRRAELRRLSLELALRVAGRHGHEPLRLHVLPEALGVPALQPGAAKRPDQRHHQHHAAADELARARAALRTAGGRAGPEVRAASASLQRADRRVHSKHAGIRRSRASEDVSDPELGLHEPVRVLARHGEEAARDDFPR
jgi:hypothetical protein